MDRSTHNDHFWSPFSLTSSEDFSLDLGDYDGWEFILIPSMVSLN